MEMLLRERGLWCSVNFWIFFLDTYSSVFSQKVVTRFFWQMELYSRHGLEVSPASNPNFFFQNSHY